MIFSPQPKPVKKDKVRKPMKRQPMRQKARKKVSDHESWYMGQVAKQPCVITGRYGVVVHHAAHGRRGRGRWNGWSCMPLVPELHDRHQPEGIHESKDRWAEKHGEDWWFIIDMLQIIYGEYWTVDH